MKKYQKIAMFATILSMLLFMNCTKEDPVIKTDQELLIEALTENTWTIDNAASDFNGEGTLDESTWIVTFSATEHIVSYLFGGDITNYLAGGSFLIAEDGTISGETMKVKTGSNLIVSSITVSCVSPYESLTISTTTSAGRVNGIGSFVIVFTR